jgi:predicted RNA polymerase sigma factor
VAFTGEHLLRELAPQVLGVVVRRFGDFSAAEDAVQEALTAAALQWPDEGLPESPRAWLIRVATRRMADHLRAELSRRRRETLLVTEAPPEQRVAPSPDVEDAVQRSGVRFHMPVESERAERLDAVLHAVYLVLNEGYASSAGPDLQRVDLSSEAIRLARALHDHLPDDGEVTGLLALMLLTDARRPARTGPDGELVPLDEQDRTLWDRAAIDEGVALITRSLSRGAVGSYQLQAAIAAVHEEAMRSEDTDWPQIMALYGLLKRMSDNPMVTLNHAIAVAMVRGAAAGLELLRSLDSDARMANHHRLDAVRGHLFEMAGDHTAAGAHYRAAANRTTSVPERNYLLAKAARVHSGNG